MKPWITMLRQIVSKPFVAFSLQKQIELGKTQEELF
jgi:hypothetical protein